jgi:hypothetical protein
MDPSQPLTESLRRDVEALTRDGERVVGGEGHRAAREWLLERIQALGLAPYHGAYELPYHHEGRSFANVLARLPGASPEHAPVLLAAHYDTCGRQPGADDNAAAIAILLAAVPVLRVRGTLERDVILAFFDAEEPPYSFGPAMGSTYFYRSQRKEPIHCAIVMDLCGHAVPIPGHGDLLFVTGMESDPGLEPVIRATSELPGLRPVALPTHSIGDLSDYHAFRLDRRPYLFLTCARWDHYHARTDTPDRLDYAKMAAMVEYVASLAGGVSTQPLDGPFEGYDTTPTEVELLRRNMGDALRGIGIEIEGRADIDRMVQRLMAAFDL